MCGAWRWAGVASQWRDCDLGTDMCNGSHIVVGWARAGGTPNDRVKLREQYSYNTPEQPYFCYCPVYVSEFRSLDNEAYNCSIHFMRSRHSRSSFDIVPL